jgi:hypothetical protein
MTRLSPAETTKEEKLAKKERLAIEGKANMARYLEQQQATLNKTARLRAQRLARMSDAGNPAKRSSKANKTSRSLLPGLHQGVRG